jgi:DNA-binding LacI/PurR family transcriptional regulator
MGGVEFMDENFLNKSTSIGLYRQLANVLKEYFVETNLPVGSRLPTEFDLSAKFGVSRGTVRHALSLLERDGLIERAPGLGTFLKQEVAAQQSSNQRRIGVIVPIVQDQLSLNILIGVESVAKYRGYQVVFNYSNESLELETENIKRMRRDQVAGMIIFPVSNQEDSATLRSLQQDKFPFVLVDRYLTGFDCDYVISDNFNGAYRAVEHLIILGHKEIAFMYHPRANLRTTSVHDRYLGYRKALEDYHLEFKEEWMVTIDESPTDPMSEDAYKDYIRFLMMPNRPNAVFTVNDGTAISLINIANKCGIKIPDELALVSFDNLRMSMQLQCPLTTVNQERTEMGVRATHLLLSRIDGRAGKPEHVVVPTNLVIRESCGARRRILNTNG